jgi:hypothetical protein
MVPALSRILPTLALIGLLPPMAPPQAPTVSTSALKSLGPDDIALLRQAIAVSKPGTVQSNRLQELAKAALATDDDHHIGVLRPIGPTVPKPKHPPTPTPRNGVSAEMISDFRVAMSDSDDSTRAAVKAFIETRLTPELRPHVALAIEELYLKGNSNLKTALNPLVIK